MHIRPTTLRRYLAAQIALVSVLLQPCANAATRTKAATGTDLAAASSWSALPTAADIASWSGTSLGAGLTLDTPSAWGGIIITSAASDISITGAASLNLGASGIDMSTSTVNLTVANNIALDASQTWNVNTSKGLTLPTTTAVSGAFVLTKSGAGTLTFNALNSSYSGGTIINAGTVTTAATGNITDTYFGTGPVTVNGGAILALSRTYLANNLALNNNATVTAGNSFASTLPAGYTTTLTGISTFNVSGGLVISGNITGTGGIIKSNTATVPVTGSNTYTGPTTISGGALKFKSSLYSNNTALWIPANITVANGAALVLNVGGSGEFNINQVGTLITQLGTSVSSNGLQAGALVGIDTSNG